MYIYFSILERSHFPCVGSSSCQLLAIDRDTYNWCGWLRDDYGMTMGWLWDDYGMTMGWPDWGQRSASHRFHKNGGQSSHPRLRSTGKKHGRSCQIIAKRFPWPLPHRCGNAAHEMDGFRAGFQEHNHLSSRSCGPSAALCGLRATTLTTPCNSAHWVSVERKNKVIWFNLILLPDLSLSLNTSGYSGYRLSIGGQVDPYRAKISNLLGLWQKSLRTCQKNIVTEAADLTVQNYIMLYIYICTHMYTNKKHLQPVSINFSYLYSAQSIQCHQGLSAWLCGELPKSTRWTFMLGTVSVRSRPKRQAQKMHAESTLQWGGRSSFWQLGNECHPRLHPLQLAVWCCKMRNRRPPVTFIAPALYIQIYWSICVGQNSVPL